MTPGTLRELSDYERKQIENPGFGERWAGGWTFHVPADIRQCWESLSLESKVIAYIVAEVADRRGPDAD